MNRGTQIVAVENSDRDNYADFLKYVLIGFVVMGHFINMHQLTKGLGGLYTWIYTFHMPLFVFISGHFSKHISNYRRKSIDTLLWPFVVFQILNIIYTAIIPLEPLKENMFYPYHQNWYLIALFWWRCFVPYRQFFRKWLVIVLSFAFSLSIGFFPEWNGFLGLYKTAYFLPFFVLGVYCADLAALIEKLMQRKWFWLSAFAVITIAVFVLSLHTGILYKVNYAFKANFGYEGVWLNLVLRTFAMLVSLMMCASVLLVTRILCNKLKLSKKLCGGGGTMLCFLGHEFIMIPVIRVYARLGLIGFFLCIITSLLVTYILTRKQIVEFFSPLMDLSVLCKKLGLKIYKE